MAILRFDGLTAIITGAGRGLGAAHARYLAGRGAAIVVNDLDGDGERRADRTVAEIAAAGGSAIAVHGSIADAAVPADLVTAAVDTFGSVDVVVNNAGIGLPAGAAELRPNDLRREYDVHVVGALALVSAAWPHLVASGHGAIVNTGSGVGMFGLQGAIGYAAAKMAVVGATRAIALEGARCGVRANVVAPMAATRMSAGVFGDLSEALRPDLVSPVVAWLAHPSCPLTGEVLSAAGGRVARAVTTVGRGALASTPEEIAELWPDLRDDEQLELAHALREPQLVRDLSPEA